MFERYQDYVKFGYKVRLFLRWLTKTLKIKDKVMNWKDIQGASKSIRNTDGINMKAENREALEAITVGLLAGGRVQEYGIAMQSLEKINAQHALGTVMKEVSGLIRDLRDGQVPAKAETDEVPAWVEGLVTRIDKLEKVLDHPDNGD